MTTQHRHQLIENHLTMARSMAFKTGRRVPSEVSRDDLEGAAYLGLTEAANRYDAGRGKSFAAYASHWIRGAILDELRRRDVMSRRDRDKVKRLARATAKAKARHGAKTSAEHIARFMGTSSAEVERCQKTVVPPVMVALDDAREQPAILFGATAVDQIAEAQQRRALAEALAELPAREQAILHMYYGESCSLREIGESLGVTESRVCQLKGRAEKSLAVLLAQAGAETGTRRRLQTGPSRRHHSLRGHRAGSRSRN